MSKYSRYSPGIKVLKILGDSNKWMPASEINKLRRGCPAITDSTLRKLLRQGYVKEKRIAYVDLYFITEEGFTMYQEVNEE